MEATVKKLRSVRDADAAFRLAPDKWSKKEILGHLIDSAANNHHRFIRAQQAELFEFPGYDQNDWVALQMYQDRSWPDLIDLWRSYNLHLAHVIRHMRSEKLEVECRIGQLGPVTLRYLVEDYLVHLKHHVQQFGAA